jgi:hypothetical protein
MMHCLAVIRCEIAGKPKRGISMSTHTKLQTIIHTIQAIPQQVIRYISGGAIRLFSPSDDNYPATGVQPYEGDPADDKSA